MPRFQFGRRLRSVWWRPPVEDEVDDEMAFHLAMRVRDLMDSGMPEAEARQEATRRLGDPVELRRRLTRLGKARDHSMQRTEWWSGLVQDIKQAVRSLRKQPGFTVAAALTLAVGIGATTAIFSVLYSVVLRPLPIPEPDRVVWITRTWEGRPGGPLSVGNYYDLLAGQNTLAAHTGGYSTQFILGSGEQPEAVRGARVTPSFFTVFGVAPALGRVFTVAEDVPGGAPVVVLSHRLWTRRFGADSAVVGQSILLNAVRHTVLGVMPAHFDFFETWDELWAPAGFAPRQIADHDGSYLFHAYGRLRPGATAEQTKASMAPTVTWLREQYPNVNASLEVHVEPLMRSVLNSAVADRIWVLFGAVGMVLLIGCVNVANLLLARGVGRGRELAVRAALGAGRGRIIRQLVTENLVLAVLAGALGLVIAHLGLQLIVAGAPANLARLDQAGLDLATVGFAMAIALGSVLLFGVLPAARVAALGIAGSLRDGSRAVTGGGEWLRRGLVATEVGLALVLLVGAGLLIRTAVHLGRVDPGFDPAPVLSGRISLPRVGYESWDRVTQTFGRIAEELAVAPGIEAAALVSQVPLGPGGNTNGLIPEGRPIEGRSAIMARLRLVTPNYFNVMRIPLRSGRAFTADDRLGTPRVMIVSEAFSREAWPDQDPIGKRLACCETAPDGGPMWKEVIGVAADVRTNGPAERGEFEYYLPITQTPATAWEWLGRTMTFVVRGAAAPAALGSSVRSAVAVVDPAVPVFQVAT
ncbi:MAG: ADOP family duplicated permease, partial [Gemmatimonadales bacterium]